MIKYGRTIAQESSTTRKTEQRGRSMGCWSEEEEGGGVEGRTIVRARSIDSSKKGIHVRVKNEKRDIVQSG